MKRLFSGHRFRLFLPAVLLIFGLILLSGCGGQKTKTLTYKGDDFKISVDVPEDSGYKFSDKTPKNLKKLFSYSSCDSYLTGGDVVVGIIGGYYTSNTGSFKAYKKYTKENKTLVGRKEVKFAGREALQSDFRYGYSPAPLYGYVYNVDASDIRESLELTLEVLPASGKKNEIKKLIKEDSVKSILDSIKVEKLD